MPGTSPGMTRRDDEARTPAFAAVTRQTGIESVLPLHVCYRPGVSFMRLVCAFVFAVFLALLPASLEAKFVCGNFDGTFSCRRESAPPKVKGAIPTARPKQDASPDAAASERSPGLGRHGLPRRHGRHPAQLPLPAELGTAGRQLCPLHRVDMQQWVSFRCPPASLPGRRGKALLQTARRRIEGLLLRHL